MVVGHARMLWIEGPAGRLEAALRIATPVRAAAVLAHPHPLHGGTLDNPVIFPDTRTSFASPFTKTTSEPPLPGIVNVEGAVPSEPSRNPSLSVAEKPNP